jgi:hypothetical protein
MSTEIDDKKITFALEVWKKTIDVQQHFNSIEMQIRNIAVTVLTASIGAAGLVYNQLQQNIREAAKAGQTVPDTNTIRLFKMSFSSSDMILFAGVIAWLAFYFMDRWWYHRLLQGAVKQAQYIENKIQETPYADLMSLSNKIRETSPVKVFGVINLRSDGKIDIFYFSVVILLFLMIAFVF